MEKLGDDRSIKVIIVGNKEVEQSLYGQLVSGKVIASGLDEELANEAKRAGIYLSRWLCAPHASIFSAQCSLLRGFPLLPFLPVSAEKQRLAKEVASMLKLSVEIDTGSSERLVHLSPVIFTKTKIKYLGPFVSFLFAPLGS